MECHLSFGRERDKPEIDIGESTYEGAYIWEEDEFFDDDWDD
ncbi:hypothetical protein ACFLZ9_02135 [Patescibacteria group bacterium]